MAFMENLFSLKLPGADGNPVELQAPSGIPTGPEFTIGSIASLAIQLALIVGIFISLGYLIYGGLYWQQASGDKQKWDKARRIIVYSVFGLIIMFLALAIVNVVASAFGLKSAVNP